MLPTNWETFIGREITERKIYSINLQRILLHLPSPNDYIFLVKSGELKSLNLYLYESLYPENNNVNNKIFVNNKTDLFKVFGVNNGNKSLDELYRLLKEKYSSIPNPNSSEFSYREAIRNAKNRIWIYQTWLPGHERDGEEIANKNISDIRLLLLSFKVNSGENPPIYSPIYSRMRGRKLKTEEGQLFSARSVEALVKKCSAQNIDIGSVVKFNCIHHPGWIAIIDELVFSGFTP